MDLGHPMQPVRVMVVDASELFRLGVGVFFEKNKEVIVCCEAANIAGAAMAAWVNSPDVALVDSRLAEKTSPLEVIGKIRKNCPGMKVIVFAIDASGDFDQWVEAGATGYLIKDVDGDELIRAIRRVASGESILHPALITGVLNDRHKSRKAEKQALFSGLTAKQCEVARLLARGHSSKRIAEELGVSEKTVRNQLSNVYSRLKVSTRAEAIVLLSKLELF